MPVNEPPEENLDINQAIYHMFLFIQLMAIRNQFLERRDQVIHDLQVLNRRLRRSKARNTNEIRERIQELETERLDSDINRLEVTASDINPTQMGLMNARLRNDNQIVAQNQ